MPELFANFEVNKAPRWPILMRLTGGSILLHLGLLWVVVYVPAFRDALNVAALIANTRFVDKAYNRTEIGNDVTLLEMSTEKFHYPEGYFALDTQASAEQLVAGNTGFAPKIISRAQSSKGAEPEASPKPSVSPTPSPSPSASVGTSPTAEADPNKKLTPEEAQTKLEQTAAENKLELPDETQLNKKVLKDFAKYAEDQKNAGKLDLDKPFEVVIEAELDKNAKLVNPRFTKKSGDPNLIDLFGRMVSA